MRNVKCLQCSETFVAKREDAIYCSNACKQAAYRKRKKRKTRSIIEQRDPTLLQTELFVKNSLHDVGNRYIRNREQECIHVLDSIDQELNTVQKAIRNNRLIDGKPRVLINGNIVEQNSREHNREIRESNKRLREFMATKRLQDESRTED